MILLPLLLGPRQLTFMTGPYYYRVSARYDWTPNIAWPKAIDFHGKSLLSTEPEDVLRLAALKTSP